MNEEFKVVILAIFDNNNFPNRVMADIHGKPMIQHVFETARQSGAAEVVIATDRARVGMAAEEFGATVCMILDDELTDLSRLAEVVDKLSWDDDAIVVNFPADAPLTPGEIIKQVADDLQSQKDADGAVLYTMVPLNVAVKETTINLIVDNSGYVMYFSRLPIPHQYSEKHKISEYRSYIGINAYRAGVLRSCRSLAESELDLAENIEELKLLYNGIRIHAAEANNVIGQRVITEDDVAKVKVQIAPTSN